ncbi:MAG: type II secretion system protein [Coriobacteriia bacterium]|nr:type II secretion system protein [Coriobacteriia bacterium]
MRMFKKEEGFTLVELMVVVLIIGILVAIAIPVFNAAQDSARKSACQNNLRVLDGATQQYLAADPDNAVDDVDADPEAVLGEYVKEWDPFCPADATSEYSVASGDFTCDFDTEHNYE